MNHLPRSARKPAVLFAAALLAAAALSACGGDNNNGNTGTGSGGGAGDVIDAFFALVQGQVSLAAETTTEPISIDSVTATSNEDKEPVALP